VPYSMGKDNVSDIVRYVPGSDALDRCFSLGIKMAERLEKEVD